jgi:hypothetical protein
MIEINREVAKCSNTWLKNLRAKDLRDGGLIEAVERKCPPIPERHHLAMSLEGSQCLAIVPSQNVPLAPYNIDNHCQVHASFPMNKTTQIHPKSPNQSPKLSFSKTTTFRIHGI